MNLDHNETSRGNDPALLQVAFGIKLQIGNSNGLLIEEE
jgi:hypothetical protein